MLSGSYGLVLHELDVELFLQRAKNLASADSVALVRWLAAHPVVELCDSVGDQPLQLSADIKESLNGFLTGSITLPVAMRDLLDDASSASAPLREHFSDPHLMAVLLDTQPSRILILLARNADSAPWSDDEFYSFMEVAKVMRQSVRCHKLVDSMKNVIQTANGLLNSSPSGVVVMQPDGEINVANRVATRILKRDDGICIQNNQLRIRDRGLEQEFTRLLAAVPEMPAETTWEFQWHRAIPRRNHKTPYQLSMQILSLRDWHIESREFDKVIIIFLADPTGLAAPTADQLQRYYGFTDAQAKVALALWGGTGISEAAEKLSISINTARTHLRAIYEKVGVANHAELMAVLTTSLNRVSNRVSEGEYYEAPEHRDRMTKPDP